MTCVLHGGNAARRVSLKEQHLPMRMSGALGLQGRGIAGDTRRYRGQATQCPKISSVLFIYLLVLFILWDCEKSVKVSKTSILR